jgi:acetyl esterase
MQTKAKIISIISCIVAFILICLIATIFFILPAYQRYLLDNVDKNLTLIRTVIDRAESTKDIDLKSTENMSIAGPNGDIKVRMSVPINVSQDSKLVIYFHGGGYVAGGLEMVDRFTKLLARDCNIVVISVDYRLAPENPYPIGLNDTVAVVKWAYENAGTIGIDKNKIFVAGDSAGAGLSAVLAQISRDKKEIHIAGQILLWPPTGKDDNGNPFPSRKIFAKTSVLTPKSMEKFEQMYTGDPEKYINDPHVHVLKANSFAGLPRALVITCELDPLRDEGLAYAEKMKNAGVEVTTQMLKGKDHGFLKPVIIPYIKQFLE